MLRVDGFSRRKDALPAVPNRIFFGGEAGADLNADLGTRGKLYDVQGLLDIFARYKFTVDENTPVEEEVALDPELLGRVFENLLASYNEDTQTTARKLSGSFYTPRVVVDYMVDEALSGYFRQQLEPAPAKPRMAPSAGRQPVNEILEFGAMAGELDLSPTPDAWDPAHGAPEAADDLERKLSSLLSYDRPGNPFNPEETQRLVAAIERLKTLDPACGSGAFPMGILGKLVQVLRKLDPGNSLWKAQNRVPLEAQLAEARKIKDIELRQAKEEDAEAALEKFDRDFADDRHADYTRKLYLIENCIHGVDIQPIAVQIAKLRFFIALVVSQTVDRDKTNLGVTPLPNLETKLVAADALMPIDRPQQMGLRDHAIDEKEDALKQANERYFAARTSRTKHKYRERIAELRDALAELLEHDRFVAPDAARQLVHWNPFDQNAAADFFDPEWMFQLPRGFDIVIGNPPYFRQEKLRGIKDALRHYACHSGTADLYVYFYERAIRLLKPGGTFVYITSNKWFRAGYGGKLRGWMSRNTRLLKIIDFGDADVFEAIAYPTIVVAIRREGERREPAPSEQVLALNWRGAQPVETFPWVFAAECFPVPQAGLNPSGWQLEPPLKRHLLERLRAAGIPLGEHVRGRFYRGILTGLNEAFVIDGDTRARLIAEDPASAEIIKPFLRGRDVKRWRVEFNDHYLIKIESSENVHHPWSELSQAVAEQTFAKCYPAIHARFMDYRQAMINRYDQGKYFWELRACAYWQEFEHPKIVYPDIYLHQSFAWDNRGYLAGNTCYFIPIRERWLAGVLNASVTEWFYEQIANRIQNGYLRAFSDYIQQVPIPMATETQKGVVDLCVNAVLCLGKSSLYEQLINGLVYELFFPDDLHAAHIRLFDACEQAGFCRLNDLADAALSNAAQAFVETVFAPDHPIPAMLADLLGLDVARLIEGRE